MKEVKELSENISDKLPSNMMLAGIGFFIAGTVGLINGNSGLLVLFILGIVFIAKAAKDKSRQTGRQTEGDEK